LTLPQTARLVDGRAVMQAYAPVRHGGSTSAVLRVASPAAPWLLGVWAVRALITFAGVTLVVVELLVYTRPRGRASAAYEVALATASDELRVPLHGMLGQIEALREADLRRDHAEIVRSLYAQARLTTRLASDLLDLGKLAAGELLLEVEPFRAHDIVQEVVQQEQAYALTRGVPLRFEASGATEALVASDPVRFRQVVARLLHHTLQTSERGPVTVTLTQHPAQNDEHVVEVAIHDPSHLPQPSRDTSLTIARALGERLGGVIAVDSPNAPTFRLPAPVAHVSQAWAAPQHTPNAPTPPLFRGPKPRVLVAEDNPVNQRILRMQLELMGLDVHVVGDGREAVRACRQQRFALVLMDLSMPEVSGVEAARLIRGMTHGHQPPIYALTGSVADDDRSDCERAGMTGFLEKPLGFDRLRATISAALPDHAMPATRAAV
ncbi:MAG TPA: response regulator, partial [Myxococcota bacterium]|nr:response regulator [Myxococcota bacterium]